MRQAFFDHPLIFSLYRGAYRPSLFENGKRVGSAPNNLPNYIPRENFALAMHDLLSGHASKLSGATERLRSAYDLIDQVSGGDVARKRMELEEWYDSAMDRTSGWYKRRTQWTLLWAGLVLAAGLNLSTFDMARTISGAGFDRARLERAAEVLSRQTPGAASAVNASTIVAPESAQATLLQLGLPIGWDDVSWKRLQTGLGQKNGVGLLFGLQFLLGLFCTAFAVMLGAPFWFDVLNKIMVIRSTVKPKEKSPDESSEDRQLRPGAAARGKPDLRTPDGDGGAAGHPQPPPPDGPEPDRPVPGAAPAATVYG